MKKIIFLFSLLLLLTSCKFPVLVKQDNQDYKLINWEGGKFYFVTYIWKGKKFDDALDIIKEFINISNNRALGEYSIGRFPSGNEWQLGIITKSDLQLTSVKGYKIESIEIPSGEYAALTAKGYPQYIFIFWDQLKKRLLKDKYKIESPVFEIYKNAFDEKTAEKDRIGEIRYKVSK